MEHIRITIQIKIESNGIEMFHFANIWGGWMVRAAAPDPPPPVSLMNQPVCTKSGVTRRSRDED